jgi:hypothetical protein
MKKLIAVFGILALAACGGGDKEGATVEDTTTVVPATEPAPVTTTPMDTTMAPAATTPMTGDSMSGAAGTTAAPMAGDTMKGDSAKM